MKKTVFSCEVCGAWKGAGNHWWMVRVEVENLTDPEFAPRLTIEAWDDDLADEERRQHVCGEEHLWKLLSPMLNNQLINAQLRRSREKQS